MHLFLTSGETCGQLSDYGDHLNISHFSLLMGVATVVSARGELPICLTTSTSGVDFCRLGLIKDPHARLIIGIGSGYRDAAWVLSRAW